MNCVFFIGEYNGYINANKKIALTIADQMEKHNNNVKFISFNYTCEKTYHTKISNYDLIVYPSCVSRINTFIEYNTIRKTNSFFKTLFFNPIIFMQYHMNNKYSDLLTSVINLINSNNYDFFFCFYNPFEPSYALLKNKKLHCKKIIYSLDSWSFSKKKFIKTFINSIQESYAFRKASLVFMQPALINKYESNIFFKPTINKISTINFPNIIRYNGKKNSIINISNKEYSIIYLGALEDYNRNPQQFLDFVISISTILDRNIHIYFIGKINSRICEFYNSNYPSTITIHEQISFEEAYTVMNLDNVILLNINNAMSDQRPSKILDYISTGNPIINIVNNINNTCFDLLDKYENHYNFYNNKNNNIGEFIVFLNNYRKIPFDSILNIYNEYTPEYIYNEIQKNILNIS